MNLKEWTKQHIKHKNLILQNLQHMEESNNEFICKYKDKTTTFSVHEQLENAARNKNTTIVCQNNKENVELLLKQWNSFVTHEHLCILFVEPKSNKKWHICPNSHDKIVEKTQLKKGIMAIYSHSRE